MEIISPAPAKAGSVQQVAQVDIQMGFEYLEKETPQPLWAAEELQILFVCGNPVAIVVLYFNLKEFVLRVVSCAKNLSLVVCK